MNHTPRTPEREPMTISVSDHLQTVFKQLIVENPNIRFGLERMHQTIREFVNEKLAADEPRIDAALKDIESLVSLRLQPKGAPAIPADQTPDFLAIHHELKKAAAIIRLKHEKGEVIWAQLDELEVLDQAEPQENPKQNFIAMARERFANFTKPKEMPEVSDENQQKASEYFNLGCDAEDPEEQMRYYQKALELNPHHAGAHNNIGVIFENRGKLTRAKKCYARAAKINPDEDLYAINLNNTKVCIRERRIRNTALAGILGTVGWGVSQGHAHWLIGDFYYTNHQEARQWYEGAIEWNPENTSALFRLASRLGKYDSEKEKLYERIIEIDPEHVGAHNNLGWILEQRGERKKAIEHYKKAHEIDPDNPYTLFRLAYSSKDQAEKEKLYERVIELNPNESDAINNLGIIYKARGDLVAAKEYHKKAIEIEPNKSLYHTNLGEVYYLEGNLEAAELQYERALLLDGDSRWAKSGLKRVRAKLSKSKTAK